MRIRHLMRRVLPAGAVAAAYRELRIIEPRLLSLVAQALRLSSGADIVSIEDLRGTRQSDTVFVMGCGYSINSISETEWKAMRDVGDIFSFNHFYRGEFVTLDYHACGEIGSATAPNYGTVLFSRKHRDAISLYYRRTFANPLYKNATYFLRYKINLMRAPATTAIWALYFSRAFKGRRLCLYSIDHHVNDIAPPSESISSISHHNATLSDVVNISYLLGYTRIVLVGVDLYDRRYFWLGENETREGDARRGTSYTDVHKTAGLIGKAMAIWNEYLRERGVKLYVYNPRSLLRAVLPLYDMQRAGEDSGES